MLTIVCILFAISGAWGQTTPFDTTPSSPCPEVLILEKYDHVGSARYRRMGWDTLVNCANRELRLTVEPYIPVQLFNGTYTVTQIPYNPPQPSFHSGQQLANNDDDKFCASPVNLEQRRIVTHADGTRDTIPAFVFSFFGYQKTAFVAGGNGILTFNTQAAGQSCNFGHYAPIPWPDNISSSQAHPTLTTHRDAIYGVFQDTDPSGHMTNPQGIWYNVIDEYPCRKIVCSYFELPWYPHGSNTNNRQTYQIVCYEGSNIIEVHIKRRRRGETTCSWCNYGLIGIQNATGAPQVGQPNDPTSPLRKVVTGSPAAFWPSGCNPMTSAQLDTIAYRFTPQGTTASNGQWFRVFDDGRPSIVLDENPNSLLDTNKRAYVAVTMGDDTNHRTRSNLIVRPDTTSRYVYRLNFRNANNDWYHLTDTIVVGTDFNNELEINSIYNTVASADTVRATCYGNNTTIRLAYPTDLQEHREVTWTVRREYNGQPVTLPETMYTLDDSRLNLTLLPDPQMDTMPRNKIDTIRLSADVEFASSCNNSRSMMVTIYPNFDTTEYHGICQGDSYRWPLDNHTYTQATTAPQVTLHSVPGCDSVVHLNLAVSNVSLTIDTISACHPITWRNGRTYSANNDATAATDTVVLTNRYGCDSVVRLQYRIFPMTPRLKASRTEFDYDHLDVELTDISTGGDSRRWRFPDGQVQTSATAYYTIPAELNEATIWLVEHSPYGCVDSTSVRIPFRKETFWVPNIFAPDADDGNNRFAPVSTNTLRQQMLIYNRRGEQVYGCDGVDCAWDGTNAEGNRLPQGAYVYIIRYTNEFEPDVTRTLTGTITLLR